MKRVLITGKNGYLAKNLYNWLSKRPETYAAERVSVRASSWADMDLNSFDAIVHTAAMVHQKETDGNAQLYSIINRDLTYNLAVKAKKSGVKQFVFISTMSVYGLEGEIGKSVVITPNTACHPNSLYGKSKLEAENMLLSLEDENFVISIIRPPMIYGPNCPGNYSRLRMLSIHWPIYPKINNQRSMIFIDNLCLFISGILTGMCGGIFTPQNKDYVSTSELVKAITDVHGKKVYFSKLLGSIVKLLSVGAIRKLYGNLVYEQEQKTPLSDISTFTGFKESILISEKKWVNSKHKS